MARRWPMKPKKSLRENAALLVPALFDACVSHQEVVLQHPRKTDALHLMRIAGKPLRCVMEVLTTIFGRQFTACLEEVKLLLGELGNVHDADVLILKLRDHLLELELFNRAVRDRTEVYRLNPVRVMLASARAERRRRYKIVCALLRRWKRTRFRTRLLESMASGRRRRRVAARRTRVRGRKRQG